MNTHRVARLVAPTAAALALAISLAHDRLYFALGAMALVATGAWLVRERAWAWRVPLVFFSVTGLAYFYRVFGGLEPNTPGLLSSGQYQPADAVVLGLCILAIISCAWDAWVAERAVGAGSVDSVRGQ